MALQVGGISGGGGGGALRMIPCPATTGMEMIEIRLPCGWGVGRGGREEIRNMDMYLLLESTLSTELWAMGGSSTRYGVYSWWG